MSNIGSERFLFDNLNSWLQYTKNAVRTLINGVLSVLVAIFAGLATALYKLCVFLAKIIRMRPLLSVALIATAMTIFWLMVSVSLKVKSKTYEHQRDSLAYELLKHKQSGVCGSVIAHDTIYINKN